MRLAGAKKQTFFLTGINAIVRAMGLTMRVWISRTLGPEAMGIMELAQSVHMIAIAPLTSGLPVAVSRLTAKADPANKHQALSSGLFLSRRISLVLIPLLWFLSPFISKLTGDVRVMPSLWFTAPCILILGYSAAYNGFCYGTERSELPAMSELLEQLMRFGLSVLLIRLLNNLTLSWIAAIPAAATLLAEFIGLIFIVCKFREFNIQPPALSWTRSVLRLSIPITLTRLMQTVIRSVTAILIPLRLQFSGLTSSEATAQLGMLNGMVNPILMLPGIFTSALSMVMVPRIAKAEEKPSELGRLLRICLYGTIPLSALMAACIRMLAPVLANVIYRQAELTVLFQQTAFQILLFPISHLVLSTLSALGQQRRSLYVSVITACSTLFLTWLLAGNPAFRIKGIIFAQYANHLLSILLGCFMLLRWKREHSFSHGDKYV